MLKHYSARSRVDARPRYSAKLFEHSTFVLKALYFDRLNVLLGHPITPYAMELIEQTIDVKEQSQGHQPSHNAMWGKDEWMHQLRNAIFFTFASLHDAK